MSLFLKKQMCVSSEEINLLVQHYLQELGYDHAAFAFGCESKIPSKEIAKKEIPPGSLVYLVQKGIMYAQMEAAADEASSNPDTLFGHQLNLLRSNIRQSSEIAEELSSATRRLRILPSSDQTDPLEFYLSQQSSLVLEGHAGPVIVSAWNSNSDLLATGSTDGTVVVWTFKRSEVQDSTDCSVLDDPLLLEPVTDSQLKSDITALKWSPTDNVLVVGTYCGTIVAYKDGKEFVPPTTHTSPVVSIDFTPNGQKFAVGHADGGVYIYQGTNLSPHNIEAGIFDVQWADDSNLLIATGNKIIKIGADGEKSTFLDNAEPIIQMIVSPKQEVVVAGDQVGNIILMKTNGTAIRTDKSHSCSVTAITFNSEEGKYTSGAIDGSIEIGSINGETKISYKDAHAPIISLVFDKENRYFAFASSNDIIGLYSVEESKLLLTFESIESINGMSWSPDGRFLTICVSNGQVNVIDFAQIC